MATATKKRKDLGKPALIAGTQKPLAIYFETFDIYGASPKNGDRVLGFL
jgi:hypothetical protein